jgi:hypothetical protein
VKYPKLAAAIDEFLAKQVGTYGADLVDFAIASLTPPVELPASSPEGAKEKLPPIPVTKELVLSEQTEVREAVAWEKVKEAAKAIGWEEKHGD